MATRVLVLTALKEEFEALRDALSGVAWETRYDGDGFRYYEATRGELRLFAAWSGEMGETAAAERCRALIDELKPAVLGLCGICAGRRGKVSLGDVIVADKVFSYDHGKMIGATPTVAARFCHEITTYNLRPQWAMEAAYLAETPAAWIGDLLAERPVSLDAQSMWLLRRLREAERGGPEAAPDRERCPDWKAAVQRLEKRGWARVEGGRLVLTDAGRAEADRDAVYHPDGPPPDPPFAAHVGPIATGKAVQEDPALFDRLAAFQRKVLGVEMEAAAVGLVAERAGIPAIVVKAVSDYGDHDKDDAWRRFACRASAAFLVAFLDAQCAVAAGADRAGLPAPGPAPLARRLAGLYVVADDIRRLLENAGLRHDGIDLTGAPRVVWSRVLREVEQFPGGRARLVTAVRADGYPIDDE